LGFVVVAFFGTFLTLPGEKAKRPGRVVAGFGAVEAGVELLGATVSDGAIVVVWSTTDVGVDVGLATTIGSGSGVPAATTTGVAGIGAGGGGATGSGSPGIPPPGIGVTTFGGGNTVDFATVVLVVDVLLDVVALLVGAVVELDDVGEEVWTLGGSVAGGSIVDDACVVLGAIVVA
jgi:hypothetical protein